MGDITPTRVLPLGFEGKTLDRALDAIAAAIGAENVSRNSSYGCLDGPQGQKHYGDYWPMDESDEHTPSAAIRPISVEEIQAVLKIANQYKLPLWTVSRGKNLGYGGSGAVVRGTVILDLHRMNKIIDVNEEYAYAIIEPGVSFLELYAYIQEKGYKLWPSCPAIGWGSIVGNATERGFGYTPNGEHSEQLCGMEVVLGTGEVVRTGMGALEGSPMWPLFRGGYGPSIDGLFFQSNLGIVTKVGMHMTAAPGHYIDCKVSVPNQDQLAILVKTLSALEREGIIQNHTSITNPYREGLTNTPLDLTLSPRVLGPGMQGGYATNEEMTDLAKEKGWGYWTAYFAIYGASAAVVNAHWAAVEEAITPIPGVKSEVQIHEGKNGQRLNASTIPGVSIPHTGVPSIDAAQIVNVRGQGGGHICFSPLFPPDGVQMQDWFTRALKMTEEASFDMFTDFHVYGRYVIAIALVVYGPNEGPRVKKLFENLLEDGAKTGVSEYRTHIDFMDDVRKQFGFNNGALGNLLTRIKEVTDPNGILSQGKSGIWTKGAALKRS